MKNYHCILKSFHKFILKVKYILDHFYSKLFSGAYDRNTSEWYYFLHIPKTAGTSFRHILYENFSQSEIYPNYVELNFKQKATYLGWQNFRINEERLFPKSKKFLVGHFGWAPMNHFKEHKPQVLTFLRDPINRFKSSIIYHQQRNRMYVGMSIADIIDQYGHREGTMQARQMGYHPKRDNLNVALKNLESIDFIGISERFEESLRLCNHSFGWKLESIPKRNVGGYTDDAFTPEQSERIRRACELDYIIYRRGIEIFEERLSEMKRAMQ